MLLTTAIDATATSRTFLHGDDSTTSAPRGVRRRLNPGIAEPSGVAPTISPSFGDVRRRAASCRVPRRRREKWGN